ncbi:MAG: zinc ribbon domain-containing protein [Firmicutes bacterium]|nr:zinc ribbon domain-containing protein [Bacillota bacterium]
MAKNAADKTTDMLETTKINAKINEEQKNIATVKQEIGDYYWQQFVAGLPLEAEPAELCRKIATATAAIEQYQSDIKTIKQEEDAPAPQPQPQAAATTKCPSCGTNVAVGKKFCVECGYNMVTAEEEEKADTKECPSCGVDVGADLKFCSECGTKLG